MSFPKHQIDYGSFLHEEQLKSDGSNFVDWYQRLRSILLQNDLLYVIEEPLGEAPRDDAGVDDYDEYRDSRDNAIAVQTMIVASMEPQMKERYQNLNPYVMVDVLKAFFAPQMRLMGFECLREFLSTKMEENTCLVSHLTNMHRIHRRLTDDLDYLMTDELAIDVVMLSLPPSYKEFIDSYVKIGDDQITFHQFMMQMRRLRVEPIAGEVIDGAGICDIQVINVFMLNTYSSFWYLILIPVLFENRTFCVRVAWRSLWHVLMASKVLMARDAPPPRLSSGLVIGIKFCNR